MEYFRRQRPWWEFTALLQGLPSHSHFVSAQRNDPQVAEWLAAQPERARWVPPPTEWTLGHELLAGIFDRLGEQTAVTANVSGRMRQPAQSPDRFPRPVTAIEKAKARAEARIERELADLITAAHASYAAEHGKEVQDAREH